MLSLKLAQTDVYTLNSIYTAYKEDSHKPQADVDSLGIFFSIICLLLFVINPYTPTSSSCHLPDCSSTTRQSLLDTKASPLAALSLDSPGRRVSRQNLSSVKGKKIHTHYKRKKESKPKKKKEQKKEVKHRRSPYCPQTPALHPSLPSAPLLCLLRSDQRAKRKEEKRRRRRRRSQERRSQRYEKLQGKTRRRGGGEEEGRRAGGGALEAADQKTKK